MVEGRGNTPEIDSIRPGNVINQYRIMETDPFPFAEGAFKRVYLVERDPLLSGDEKTGPLKLHVLKLFKPLADIDSYSSSRNLAYLNGDRLKKFYSEVTMLQKAGGHPNIATIVQAGRYNIGDRDANAVGLLYFVEEYVKGRTLRMVINEAKQGSIDGIVDKEFYRFSIGTFQQIASALSFLHERLGMAHLDVKPENVLIEESTNRAVLTDFGNACLIENKNYYQEGSLLYRSPEQILEERKREKLRAECSTDMWAFGVLIYECLTGQYPFETSQPDWSELTQEQKSAAREELRMNILDIKKLKRLPVNISRINYQASRKIIDLVSKLLVRHSEQRLGIRKATIRLGAMKGGLSTRLQYEQP